MLQRPPDELHLSPHEGDALIERLERNTLSAEDRCVLIQVVRWLFWLVFVVHHRVQARRGFQKAVVATARKLTILAWHLAVKDQDYAFARPSLVAHKRRKLELAAGAPSRRGNHGTPGAGYNDKARRQAETLAAERAEHAYQLMVAHWQPRGPASRTPRP